MKDKTPNKDRKKNGVRDATQKRRVRKLTLKGCLTAIVIAVMVRQIFMANYENVFMCGLTLVLFAVPLFIDRKLGIDIPPGLEAVVLCFIFAAEILGEVDSFYTRIKHWDTMLHTVNGFLMAAVGFALVDIFNRSEKFAFKLSPFFLAVVAFCFSMTIGVLWEFFEFSMDVIFATDMQKDYIIHQVNSVKFNPTGLNAVIRIPIKSLIVNGEDWIAKYGGYIDVGLIDTMKDLIVNFIGAVVFSFIGFFYVKTRGKGKIAKQFIPTVKEKTEE